MDCFLVLSSKHIEEAMSQVLQDQMPKIVSVPKEAEDLALPLGPVKAILYALAMKCHPSLLSFCRVEC